MKKIFDIYSKYKEIINYLIFGVLTTIVNFIIYFLCIDIFNIHYIFANSIAWFFSVLFAYITNRIFVFEQVNFGIYGIIREISLFFIARLLSGVIETGLLFILVDYIGISSKISKVAVAVIVVILNYVFSKLIIFKKSKT